MALPIFKNSFVQLTLILIVCSVVIGFGSAFFFANWHITKAIELMDRNDPYYIVKGEAHLKEAMALGQGTFIGDRAERFLRCNWPAQTVPPEAAQLHTQAIVSVATNSKVSEDIWRSCIKRYPSFEFPYCCLAVLIMNKEPEESERLLNHLVKTRPDYVRPYVRLSELEESRGHLDKAQDYIRKALELNPDDVAVRQQARKFHWSVSDPLSGAVYSPL